MTCSASVRSNGLAVLRHFSGAASAPLVVEPSTQSTGSSLVSHCTAREHNGFDYFSLPLLPRVSSHQLLAQTQLTRLAVVAAVCPPSSRPPLPILSTRPSTACKSCKRAQACFRPSSTQREQAASRACGTASRLASFARRRTRLRGSSCTISSGTKRWLGGVVQRRSGSLLVVQESPVGLLGMSGSSFAPSTKH